MRWISWFAGIVIAVAVVAIGLVVLFPADRVASMAADRFEASTGRALSFDDDVSLSLSPLGVRTGAVTVANADWSDGTPMLRADAMAIGVNLISLIRGTINVETLEINGPAIVLETNADGVGNWEFAGGETTGASNSSSGGSLPEISVDNAVITDGSLIWRDGVSGSETQLSGIGAELSLPAMNATLTARAEAALNGAPISFDGQIEGLRRFLENGASQIAADLTFADAKARIDGRAGLVPLAADLTIDADLGATDALAVAFGGTAPGLPAGMGQTVAIDGAVTFTEGRIALRDGVIDLGGNAITGAADVDLSGKKPVVTADLSAGALDLSALSGGESAGGGGEATAGWSTAPIDASGLGAFDGTIALSADSIDTGSLQIGAARLVTEIKNARAVTEIRELSAYEGAVTGRVVVNARDGLSARVNVQLRDMAMLGLMRDLAGSERLATTADMDVKLLTSGTSMDAMMRGLEGEGGLRFGQGEIRGIDLAALIGGLDPSATDPSARTIFSSIAATFAVQNGVLRNDDLAFEAQLLRAEGAGDVDIGAQTLDYRVTPIVLPGADDGGLRVHVVFSGPWADLKIRPDLEGLAGGRVQEELDALEDRAREEIAERLGVEIDEDADVEDVVRDVVGERLGVTAEDGQSTEDALREGVEDALRDGLGGFLNRN